MTGRRFALVLASAGLHALAMPPCDVSALAWVALVPFFCALHGLGPLAGAAAGLVWGTAAIWGVGYWVPLAFASYYQQPLWFGVLFALGASIVFAGSYTAGFGACACARPFRSTGGAARVVVLALLWVAWELARARLLTGDPWLLLGYALGRERAFVQIADLGGVYAVSFLVVLVNAALAEIVVTRPAPRRALRALAPAAVAVVAAFAYGALRLAAPLPTADAVPVVVVQGNNDLGMQWREEFYGRGLEEYLRMTADAAARIHPALVVWPESAMTFFVEDEPSYRTAIAGVLSRGGLQLLAGGPHVVRNRDPLFYNSAFLISSSGEILARYDKQRLLPFAEYFPVASVGLLRREFARIREFSPGPPAAPLATVAGAAGVVICNEVMFPEIAAERVRTGATYLVNLSNDSWPGDPQFAAEALDMARLRAIEERRYLVRASTSGPSAIVDPLGRIVVGTAPFTRATITGTLRASEAITLYGRFGDVFAVGCVLVTLAGALGGALMPGTRRPEAPAERHPTAAAR